MRGQPEQRMPYSLESNFNLGIGIGQCSSRHSTVRPADLKFLRSLSETKNLHRRILGPIARTGMNLSRGTPNISRLQPTCRPDGVRVSGRPVQADAHTALPAGVPIELRCGTVLCYDKIGAPVIVEIAHSGAALLAVNDDA